MAPALLELAEPTAEAAELEAPETLAEPEREDELIMEPVADADEAEAEEEPEARLVPAAAARDWIPFPIEV
jgi:hypothetical protein